MSRSSFLKVVGMVSAIVLAMTFASAAQILPPTVSTMIPFAQDNGYKPEASLLPGERWQPVRNNLLRWQIQ